MSIKGYVIAGGLSIAAHVALVIVQEPKAIAMPAGYQSDSVSLKFNNVASTPTPSETKTQPVDESQSEAQQTQIAQRKPSNIVKQEKPQPIQPKTSKPRQNKATASKSSTTKTNQPVERKPVLKQQTELVDPPTQQTVTKKVNNGLNQEPVLLTKASFLSRPTTPKYPRIAKKRGIEGVVMYEVWLDKNGKQTKQVLISSSGATMLDLSALDAIKTWQFSPQIVDGQRVAHRIQIPVRFKLDR